MTISAQIRLAKFGMATLVVFLSFCLFNDFSRSFTWQGLSLSVICIIAAFSLIYGGKK